MQQPSVHNPKNLSGRVSWTEAEDLVLVAHGRLNEMDIAPVQAWCERNGCGRRMSFDTFKFKTDKDKSLFLLTWS